MTLTWEVIFMFLVFSLLFCDNYIAELGFVAEMRWVPVEDSGDGGDRVKNEPRGLRSFCIVIKDRD